MPDLRFSPPSLPYPHGVRLPEFPGSHCHHPCLTEGGRRTADIAFQGSSPAFPRRFWSGSKTCHMWGLLGPPTLTRSMRPPVLHLLSSMSTGQRRSAPRAPQASVLSSREGARPPHPPHKLLTGVTAHLHASRLCLPNALGRSHALGAAESDVCVAGGGAPPPSAHRAAVGAPSRRLRRCAAAVRGRTRASCAPPVRLPPGAGLSSRPHLASQVPFRSSPRPPPASARRPASPAWPPPPPPPAAASPSPLAAAERAARDRLARPISVTFRRVGVGCTRDPW